MVNKKFTVTTFIFFCFAFFGHSIIASEKLVIVGTGSGSSILKSIGKAFEKKYPQIIISIPKSIGSGGGIRAVNNDEYIIGRTARNLEKGETENGLMELSFAKIPIVFFVNKTVLLENISPAILSKIYDGTIRKWEDIGGGTGKIRVIRREDGDSSLIVLRKTLPGFKNIILTRRSKTTFSDPATIEECAHKKNTIAFGIWPNIKLNPDVHELKINRIHPTNAKYPCVGTLNLIYKEKNNTGIVKKFLEFLRTDEVRRRIIKAGGLPVL